MISRRIRDLMLLFLLMDAFAAIVKTEASRPWDGIVGGAVLWLLIYAAAYLFRSRPIDMKSLWPE